MSDARGYQVADRTQVNLAGEMHGSAQTFTVDVTDPLAVDAARLARAGTLLRREDLDEGAPGPEPLAAVNGPAATLQAKGSRFLVNDDSADKADATGPGGGFVAVGR